MAKVFSRHKLAVRLLFKDENLKNLTRIILKKRNVIFGLRPLKRLIEWETRAYWIELGKARKRFYYKIFMSFDPLKLSLVPYNKTEQLEFLCHEWAHIELGHLFQETNCGVCKKQCLGQELEVNIVINGLLKQIGVKIIRNKTYWRKTIIEVMNQCQKEDDSPCLQTIFNGNCPDAELIRLYLKMIALDAKEGFLSK